MKEEEFEDEKKELKEQLQNLQNDYANFGVGIEFLEQEIYMDNCSEEKLKNLIEDIEVWLSTIETTISNLDEAKIIFLKKQIINNLSGYKSCKNQ